MSHMYSVSESSGLLLITSKFIPHPPRGGFPVALTPHVVPMSLGTGSSCVSTDAHSRVTESHIQGTQLQTRSECHLPSIDKCCWINATSILHFQCPTEISEKLLFFVDTTFIVISLARTPMRLLEQYPRIRRGTTLLLSASVLFTCIFVPCRRRKLFPCQSFSFRSQPRRLLGSSCVFMDWSKASPPHTRYT